MTWDSPTMYREGLGFFTGIVDAVDDASWHNPSPCDGWLAIDVLGHVGKATEMGTRILTSQDMTIDLNEPHGAAVQGDPATWWAHLATESRAALEGVEDLDREVDSPRGRRTVREGLSFPAVDLFVHGWDLGTATGQRVTIPDEAIAFVETMFANIPSDVCRRPGVFADELDPRIDASPTERLIAFTGRDPQWTMPHSA